MAEKRSYKLEAASFEGPLDLLLALIQKHKLDIRDIEISLLLEQYLASIEQMTDLDDASEFLEMAARLVRIKTAMLLPRHEEEGEALRRELQGELVEYQLCKEAAARLAARYRGQQVFSRAPQQFDADMTYNFQHEPPQIADAYQSALGRRGRRLPPPVTAFSRIVQRRTVSVASRAVILLKQLYKRKKLRFAELFTGSDRSERVAMFLALLELCKKGRVYVSDDCKTVSLKKTLREERAGRRARRRKEGDSLAAGGI